MKRPADLVSAFESAVSESAQDSINAIVREFSLTQSRHGLNAAIVALATAFTTSEFRLRSMVLRREISELDATAKRTEHFRPVGLPD